MNVRELLENKLSLGNQKFERLNNKLYEAEKGYDSSAKYLALMGMNFINKQNEVYLELYIYAGSNEDIEEEIKRKIKAQNEEDYQAIKNNQWSEDKTIKSIARNTALSEILEEIKKL